MIKRKKLLLLISFTVSVNAFLLAGCGAKTDETKETAVVSSIEETSSEEESTTPVSYTHLDVYKRQTSYFAASVRIPSLSIMLICLSAIE